VTDKTEPKPEGPAPEYGFHPIAELFPMIDDKELAELAEDIKKNGLLEPIMIYEGKILDGRNRYKAAKLAGLVLKNWQCRQFVRDDAEAFVISANIRRRHLTTEQKRDLLAKLIKADPAASDRSIAKVAGVDNKTIGAVRAGLETTEEFPQLETRVGADGKKRKRKKTTRTETEKAVTDFRRYRELMVEALSGFDSYTFAKEDVDKSKARLDDALKQLGEEFDAEADQATA
jgi:hypothetical protein